MNLKFTSQNVEKRPKYLQLMQTDFFRTNNSRIDRDSFTKNWLRSSNLIPAEVPKLPESAKVFGAAPDGPQFTNSMSFDTPFSKIPPKSAVYTPQQITAGNYGQNGFSGSKNGFTAINTDWHARGRENWASFTNAGPVGINSVPVQIENQTNNSDLISLQDQ